MIRRLISYAFRGKDGVVRRAKSDTGSATYTPEKAAQVLASIEKHGGTVVDRNVSTVKVAETPAQAILRVAKADIGKSESPAGSNSGPYVTPLLRAAGCPDHNPWCCAAATAWVNRAAAECGGVLPVLQTAGCGTLRAWAQAHGRWVAAGPSVVPKPGWIGIVHPDEHAAVIESSNGAVANTISGNTSAHDGSNYNGGTVAEHPYPQNIFSGYVRTY